MLAPTSDSDHAECAIVLTQLYNWTLICQCSNVDVIGTVHLISDDDDDDDDDNDDDDDDVDVDVDVDDGECPVFNSFCYYAAKHLCTAAAAAATMR